MQWDLGPLGLADIWMIRRMLLNLPERAQS